MTSAPRRCRAMMTSLPSSPLPSSMTRVAEGLKGVPIFISCVADGWLWRHDKLIPCLVARAGTEYLQQHQGGLEIGRSRIAQRLAELEGLPAHAQKPGGRRLAVQFPVGLQHGRRVHGMGSVAGV